MSNQNAVLFHGQPDKYGLVLDLEINYVGEYILTRTCLAFGPFGSITDYSRWYRKLKAELKRIHLQNETKYRVIIKLIGCMSKLPAHRYYHVPQDPIERAHELPYLVLSEVGGLFTVYDSLPALSYEKI